jgi:hypothetical protein
MPYVAEWGWHIKNKETSYLLMEFNFWLSRFRMPLLFFISGTVTYFMMQRRSSGSFIKLRLRRLLVPLLVGIFFIVPPQIYMERLTQGFKAITSIFILRCTTLLPIRKAIPVGITSGLLLTCLFTMWYLRLSSNGASIIRTSSLFLVRLQVAKRYTC